MPCTISNYIYEIKEQANILNEKIFLHPQLANDEYKALEFFSEFMADYGFKTETGAFGVDTAFVSRYGTDGPIIGLVAEYDALPGLWQQAVPYYSGDTNLPGHGCGHNLLGVACAVAAVALKKYIEENNISAQIVLYGCPAEEILEGKIVMAHAGAFKELDVALSWHPADFNRTSNTLCQAMDAISFSFEGRAAHAAAAPHLGRSALDACELMNVGVNYLREHITDGQRMHYIYENGGDKPNIVHERASTLYYLRASSRELVNDTTDRVINIAKGAALMTDTTLKYEFRTRGYETLINHTLAKLIHEVMLKTPLPKYTAKEYEFAKTLSENIDSKPEFSNEIEPYTKGEVKQAFGSTDFSDVSQIVPSGAFRCVCSPIGTPLHHWAMTACSGNSIGEKGMLYAAEIMASSAAVLIEDSDILAEVKKEFEQTATGWWDDKKVNG